MAVRLRRDNRVTNVAFLAACAVGDAPRTKTRHALKIVRGHAFITVFGDENGLLELG